MENKDLEFAFKIGLHFRSIRPRTESEIRKYFARKKVSSENIEAVIKKFISNKLIDDAEFAKMYCRDILKFKPISKQALINKLCSKGINLQLAKETSIEFYKDIDSGILIENLINKKMKRFNLIKKDSNSEKQRKLIFQFLLRRGFSFDEINKKLNQYFNE